MALSFLQKGLDSSKLAEQEQLEYQQRKEQQGKAFRFSLEEGEKGCRITFVDGEIDPTFGVLMPDRCYEHHCKVNGKWGHVHVCPEKTRPDLKDTCPICAENEYKAYLAAFFTVIDHRTYTSKDGQKTYTDQRKLFVAKPMTFEELNAIAVKRGGLAGATFEVRRQGKNSAGVGSHFDFEGKQPIADLQQKYIQKVTDPKGNVSISTLFVPFDYSEELVYRTGDELRKMGLGKTVGNLSPGGNIVTPATATPDYSKHF